MRTVITTLALGSLIACFSLVAFGQDAHHSKNESDHPHWSYSGAGGPDHWSELEPAFAPCKMGEYESPIDIEGATKSDLAALQFAYQPSPLTFVDNGHTLMVNYAAGSELTLRGKKYQLKQFHFHHPSEEHISGKPFEMVVHLVHADDQGHLAVVASLVKPGRENPLLATLWKNIPHEKEKPETRSEVTIQASDLLPDTRGYYEFQGSLTTPPCTEGVEWFVLKTPIEASTAQIDTFARIYPNNARPVQPLHGRKILESRD